jgi:RNA polymerase-binding transcription factor DksA
MSDLPLVAPAPAFDRARDLPRLEAVAQDLAAVEAALARLDNDTYGRCTHCGEEISDTRLAQHPATEDCGAHGG